MATRPASGVRRWLVVLAVVVAMVIGASALVTWLIQPGSGPELYLIQVSGDVTLEPQDGTVQRATAGQQVSAGDQLRTGPGESEAVIAGGGDLRLTLDPSTSIEVVSVQPELAVLDIDDGRIHAEVSRGGPAVRVGSDGRGVESAEGAFDVVVTDEGVLAVDVTAGTARTYGFDGAGALAAGGRVTVLPDGASAHGPIPDEAVLGVDWPDEERTRAETLLVSGTTAPGARVELRGGGEAVLVQADEAGRFRAEVPLAEGDHPLTVVSTDPFGNRVEDETRIVVDRTAPVLRGGGREPP